MFTLNRITRVLSNIEGAPAAVSVGNESVDKVASQSTNAHDFNPSVIQQGENLLDKMKEQAQVQEKSQEETGSVTPEDAVIEPVVEPVVAPKAGDEQVDQGDATVEEGAAEELSKDTPAVEFEYMYKGVAVEITNTPEMETAFTEKGLDINAINKELYSKDGLSEESRTKLDEAFGKMSVDMYLQGLEKSNEATFATSAIESDKIAEKMQGICNKASGDRFDDVMKWANDNLNAEDYKAYETVINGDNETSMRLAVEDLTRRSGAVSLEAPSVAVKSNLLEATNTEKATQTGGISGREYREAHTSGEYAKNNSLWDGRRQQGINEGIGFNR